MLSVPRNLRLSRLLLLGHAGTGVLRAVFADGAGGLQSVQSSTYPAAPAVAGAAGACDGDEEEQQWPQYILIIDAGSSGSRLRMFRRHVVGGTLDEVLPAAQDEHSFEIEPGLSAFAEEPSDAGPSLAPLLAAASRNLPQEEHARAKLWLKATAGLRILSPTALRRLFGEVNTYLLDTQKNPFKFVTSEVLGGEEEAVFAYLSINHRLGHIENTDNAAGVLDMGGASMQIAYEPKGDILANEYSYYVHRHRKSVYAKSYIRFGINEALERLVRIVLASAAPGAASVEFPCFNPGVQETVVIDGRSVNLSGTGNNALCERSSRELLHEDYECMLEPCPMMGVHMSPANGVHFYAISGFFYVVAGLGLIGWDEVKAVTPQQILDSCRALCERTPGDALAHSGAPWKYLKGFCFAGHYVRHVLRALGFADNSTSVTFVRRFPSNGGVADWTLGAGLFETQYMPLTLPGRNCMGSTERRCSAGSAAASGDRGSYQQLSDASLPPAGAPAAASSSGDEGRTATLVGVCSTAAVAYLALSTMWRSRWRSLPSMDEDRGACRRGASHLRMGLVVDEAGCIADGEAVRLLDEAGSMW